MFDSRKSNLYKNKVQKFYPMPVSSPYKKKKINFLSIWFLKKLKFLVEWAIKLREKNQNVNRQILTELNLPQDLDIKKLGNYHKQEFIRLKYIFYSKNVKAKNFVEPEKFYLLEESFHSFTNKSENSVIEMFKSMRNKYEND